jgi:heme exporter protein C
VSHTQRPPTAASSQRGADLLLAFATVVVLSVGIFMAFVYAPTDRVQGHAQRIFYVHVPMAWLAYLAFTVLFIGSIGSLWKRSRRMDRLARSSAELGFLFTSLVLITGSIWGRPIWGAWWSWDARLTTTLILWFIYLGYFMIRAYAGDRERAARYSAVLGIVGMVDIPIIHMSVRWWRTLHPEPVVINTTGPNLPDSMLATLLVCFLGFTLLYVYLLVQKVRVEQVRDILADRELMALLSSEASMPARVPLQTPRIAPEPSGGSEGS